MAELVEGGAAGAGKVRQEGRFVDHDQRKSPMRGKCGLSERPKHAPTLILV